jgi:anti-sigma factor RsiW
MSTEGFKAFAVPSPECEQARRLIRAFIENELNRGQAARLSVHLKSCATCQAEYVEKLNSVAQLASELRGLENRMSVSPLALPLESAAESSLERPTDYLARGRRRRGLVLRGTSALFALSGVGLLIALCWPDQVVRTLTAEASGGRVDIGNQAVLEANEKIDWARGQWCKVPLGSTARLSSPRGRVELPGPAKALLEAPDPVRMRLEQGTASIEGVVTLTHGLAVVEVVGAEARARARVLDTTLEVSCQAGEVVLNSASGQLTLKAGEAGRAGASGELFRLDTLAR